MKLGYIGLGKMGYKMVERLLESNYEVVVSTPNKDVVEKARELGAEGVLSNAQVVSSLAGPRLIWIMVPWKAVDSVMAEIIPELKEGDTVIDGGNSPYKESIRRGEELAKKGINFLDAGVSGGPSGARNGACIMVGGKKDIFNKYEQLFKDLSVPSGYGYMGEVGAGHFVKMVHNGIEYGMMQAIAEGFGIMKASNFNLNLEEVARVYENKSVVESRLVSWLKSAYVEYGQDLQEISGKVSHSGEGLWTVEAAEEVGIPAPIIKGALEFREQSQESPSYTGQVVSALRNQFGGHEVKVSDT